MTFRSSIVEKIDTLPNETIHMTFGCVVHLHGHKNKVVPLMKPSILAITLSFAIAHYGQLMTFKAIVSYIKLVTTTSTMKT